MPTENAVEECSKCGAVMSFVCFIDKKTKEEIPAGFMEKGTMSGGLLSGTLRRYRCSNGHAGTRENDDFPVKEFQILDENDSFRNAKELVGYAEIHSKTERALISFKHLVCLTYIADYDLSSITRENVEERNNFHSLHTYPGIIDKAKNRLKTLPSNWLEQSSKQLEVQG